MPKLSLLATTLLLTSAVYATEYNYEITPLVGMVFPEGNLQIDNQMLVGGEIQINNLIDTIKPELQILHSLTSDYDGNDATTAITRMGLNGVYEFDTEDSITPFVKMGLGYETVYYRYFKNDDSPYAAAAAGIKVPFADRFAVKLETQYMLKYNDARYDSNLAIMAGITYSFGPKQEADVKEITPAVVATSAVAATYVEVDSDSDGVLDVNDKCPNSPAGITANAEGCEADSDRDGIIDEKDKCLHTLSDVEVDSEGCAKNFTLNINFAYDSDVITAKKKEDIEALATYLQNNPQYNVTIIGHTDSIGNDIYNLKLSKRRAESLKKALINLGVAQNRMTISGRGEYSPIASNETKDGRNKNRRLELTFSQK